MVMKKNMMRKNLRQSIVKSLGRYIAIVAIIALGAGLFVGLLSSKMDMVLTAQNYMDAQNMYDLSLLSTYGWNRDQVEQIEQLSGVESAEGMVFLDVIGTVGDRDTEGVFQLYSMPRQMNQVYLLQGRMPTAPNECLLDGFYAKDWMLNSTFHVAADNDEATLDNLNETEYTIVGLVSTPLFMDMTRNNTTLGDGSIDAYIYLPQEAFDVDYYTRIDVRIPGDHSVYTDEFTELMDHAAETLEPELQHLADQRYEQVSGEAWDAYHEGLAEYEDGLQELEDATADADRQLADAKAELEQAEQEIADNEQKLIDGEKQIFSGKAQLEQTRRQLNQAEKDLAQAEIDGAAQIEAARKELQEKKQMVDSNLAQVNSGLEQLNDGIRKLDIAIGAVDAAMVPINQGIEVVRQALSDVDAEIEDARTELQKIQEAVPLNPALVAIVQARLDRLQARHERYAKNFEELVAQGAPYLEQIQGLKDQRDELVAKRTEVENAKAALESAKQQIRAGSQELDRQEELAKQQLADARQQITDGKAQVQNGLYLLDRKGKELEDGKVQLADAKVQLADGWEEYRTSEVDVRNQLADARGELQDAELQLTDAKTQLDAMKPAAVYALTRDTNIGYQGVNSNSDIVAGVSRVFPIFFLLVAALVCITTMTRMVEEERTEIGTLKALGYSNGSIIRKYLIYAGSAAIVGCGIGVLAGSIIFPKIIWQAYSIILRLKPKLDITFNIPLCLIVLVVYTALMLLVTWSSCRMALRQVPAELIRPKAPTAGKKIWMEHLPFWKHLRFLDKVMFRNIFRYRQRLLMMLVGICGCTALLVTGFGIGDSIKDIVSYQFEEVTLYDMQVQFTEGLDQEEQQQLRQDMAGETSAMAFAHQSTVDVEFDGQKHSSYLIAGGNDIAQFYSLHQGKDPLTLPPPGQVMLSIGVADKLGVNVGDTVTLRNGDMENITVTVASIFDNNVFNYAIVNPQTIEDQLGYYPEYQIAYVNAAEGMDPSTVGADFSAMNNVMNVMVSQALAGQVGSMLDAMDLIVATVVFCAGMLAIIVLYNLTNINITERMREIATIKVLGFNSRETAMYVFKENLVLSVVGSAIGLLAGKFLLDFVMSQIKIDMVWFEARVLPVSLLLSIGITILMAIVVDLILYFRIDRINMAEALKSVE